MQEAMSEGSAGRYVSVIRKLYLLCQRSARSGHRVGSNKESVGQAERIVKDHCRQFRSNDVSILEIAEHDHRHVLVGKAQNLRREAFDRSWMDYLKPFG